MLETQVLRKNEFEFAVSKDFDLRDQRLMLSLGPLTKSKYCTYSCPFCYVNSPDYLNFVAMGIADIVRWADAHSSEFDMIYVSGDTDSFAPPRTEKGLELLDALSVFNADLLFTTRALFSETQLQTLSQIQEKVRNKGRTLIGCVSISQLYHPYLEPKPIPLPEARIRQLKHFKDIGIISVLTIRPFLPVIPTSEYLEIFEKSKNFVDLVLGSDWYADPGGLLESKVFQHENIGKARIKYDQMDCDINDAIWKIYKNDDAEKQVARACQVNNLPFFMRSLPAIKWLRKNLNNL